MDITTARDRPGASRRASLGSSRVGRSVLAAGLMLWASAEHAALPSAYADDGNTIPPWFQEVISSYVSILNDCDYSLSNHWKNAAHLMGNPARAEAIHKALNERKPETVFSGAELAMLRYAEKLTLAPGTMIEDDVFAMRDAGMDDGAILEANQIICYFNYVNRSLNGLGVTTAGDIVGYYKDGQSKGE